MQNLAELIRQSAARWPQGEALVCGEHRLDYAQLWTGVEDLAAVLARRGIARGDRVAVYLEKGVETVLAMFGGLWLGAVIVPINPVLKPDQVAHILQDSGARLLVTSRLRTQLLDRQLRDCFAIETVLVVDDQDLPEGAFRPFAIAHLRHERARGGEAPSRAETIDCDVAAILYTSGSTGLPKGVVLSHRNLIEGARSVAQYLENDENDRILSLLPLSFDAGFSQLTTAFLSGACVVLVNFILADEVAAVCAGERITGITGVPPLWAKLVRTAWPDAARSTLRYAATTGGRMPPETLATIRTVFPAAQVYLMYGLTEAFRSTFLDPGEVDRRPTSIGKAIPNARVLVVRADGTICNPGETGELVHVGAHVAQGYLNQPELTERRFRPSPEPGLPSVRRPMAVWSGDLVRTDDDGFLYFVERSDNLIKTSGYRVSPTEIETVVFESGLVTEAAAFGIDDPELGQAIAVAVAGAPDASDKLLEQCRRKLPAYMVPKVIIDIDPLPRSPNGKYDYKKIKNMWEASGERGDGE